MGRITRKRLAAWFAAAAMLPALAACGGGESDDAAAEGELVPFVINNSSFTLPYLPMWVGLHQGYFEDEGLDVEIVTSGAAVAALVSGQADVLGGSLQQGYGPINEGQDLKLLGLRYSGGVIAFAASTPEIGSVQDCKTWATFSPGSGTYMWAVALTQAFGIDDPEIRASSDFGAIAGMLASGQVNCANGTYDSLAPLVAEGKAKWVVRPDQGDLPAAISEFPDSGTWVTQKALDTKRDELVGFIRALNRAEDWIAKTPALEVVEFVQSKVPEYRTMEAADMAEQLEINNAFAAPDNGTIDEDLYNRFLQYMNDGGFDFLDPSDSKFSYENVVDLSVLEEATS